MNPQEPNDQQARRQFRIWVAGRLSEGFAQGFDDRTDRFGKVEQHDYPGGTVLSGEVVDESRVHGILDILRQLGVEVVRFESYRAEEPPPTDTTPGEPSR